MAYFVPFQKFNGQTNMDIDERILNNSIKNSLSPTLRLYGWSNPTITLGRNQSVSGINSQYCAETNIDISRRISGGRAVLHDNEVTYSFVCPVNYLSNGASVIASYKEISGALIQSFRMLGVELEYPACKKVSPENGYCMALSTGSDLSFDGKKLIGSAQFRKQGYILQHGSILLDIDSDMLVNAFCNAISYNEFTTLKNINPEITDVGMICEAIKKGFEQALGLTFEDKHTDANNE